MTASHLTGSATPLPGSGAGVRAEVEPGSLRTHTLKHDKSDEVLPLLTAYGKALDWVLDYMEDRDVDGGQDQGEKAGRALPQLREGTTTSSRSRCGINTWRAGRSRRSGPARRR